MNGENASRRPALEQFAHPILSAALGGVFVLAFSRLLTDFAGIPWLGMLGVPLLLATVIALVAVESALTRSRAGSAPRVRFYVVTLLIVYGAYVASGSGSLTERLALDAVSVYRIILIVLTWLLTGQFLSALRERGNLLSIYEGKSLEERERAMRQHGDVASDALGQLARLRGGVTFMLLLLVGILIAGTVSVGRAGLVSFVLVLCFAVLRYVNTAVVNSTLDELRVYMQGLEVPESFHRQRMAYVVMILVISGVVALLIAGDRSIFPFTVILAAIGAFMRFLSHLVPQIPDVERPRSELEYDHVMRDFARPQEEVPTDPATSALWEQIGAVIQHVALALGILLLLGFILSPLFSREFRRALRRLELRHALRAWFVELVRRIRRMFALVFSAFALFRFRSRVRKRIEEQTGGRSTPVTRFGAKLSFKKRRQLAAFSRKYARLIDWAQERGTERSPSDTPSEFGARIVRTFQGLAKDVELVTEIYEEGVYSLHEVLDERIAQFDRALERILHSTAAQQQADEEPPEQHGSGGPSGKRAEAD